MGGAIVPDDDRIASQNKKLKVIKQDDRLPELEAKLGREPKGVPVTEDRSLTSSTGVLAASTSKAALPDGGIGANRNVRPNFKLRNLLEDETTQRRSPEIRTLDGVIAL